MIRWFGLGCLDEQYPTSVDYDVTIVTLDTAGSMGVEYHCVARMLDVMWLTKTCHKCVVSS